jgi:hypothetical protein
MPIQSTTRDIRLLQLLQLLPRQSDDAIKCTLFTVSLNTSPKYEAISYTWGQPEDKTSISVNGVSTTIPTNLEHALRHLRKEDTPLSLWADSICIDQDNDFEKNHQVAMMGDIYRSCTSVYIWLGIPPKEKATGDTTDAVMNPFSVTLHFAKRGHIHELPCFQYAESTGTWSFLESPMFERTWSAFVGVISCSWWSRLWCVQETLLSPSALLVYGRWRIPFDDMTLGHIRHREHLGNCCNKVVTLFPSGRYLNNPGHIITTASLTHATATPSRYEVTRDIDQVLRSFRYKDCKDPRDQIYGLLSLLDESISQEI